MTRCAATKVPLDALLKAAVDAADKGAAIVMEAANRPKKIERKEGNDVVTETDKAAELAIVSSLTAAFPDHAILGEEGGVLGDINSDYLWSVDPLDGTCSFSTGYSHFCVSVGVLRRGRPVAGCIIEFLGGGPGGLGSWHTRKFTATRNGGAFLDGKPLTVSSTRQLRDAVVATEACWFDDPAIQAHHTQLLQDLTRDTRGVRMCGAAAANCCHLAMGVVDAYVQPDLKPWDVAAGAIIIEEAGGRITTWDGLAWSPFDRTFLATNDAMYGQVLKLTEPVLTSLREAGADQRPWFVPAGYKIKAGSGE